MEAVTAARTATAWATSVGLVEELHAVQAAMMDCAVAGGNLDVVVRLAADAVGGPVAISLPRWGAVTASAECSPVEVAAVRAWVEQRTRGRPAAVPAAIVAAVPIRLHDDVRGMVLLLQSDRRPRQAATAFLHAAAMAALTMLAIDEAREETARQLRGSLLEELRSRNDLSGAEIVRRAARLRCDLSTGAVILCAELKGDRARLVTMWISAEHPGAIAEQLEAVDGGRPARVYAALPAGVDDGSSAAAFASARQLAARLQQHATVGLSTFRADPGELGDALREAELVLDVALRSAAPIRDEIASGTYKLLFRMVASHPEEVRSFYHATVDPLVHYDDQYQTELVATLQAYLDANCNMNATAAAIYAHRHTVAYRLERIRELTGLDPTRSDDRERLGLGLKVNRIIGTGRSGGRG